MTDFLVEQSEKISPDYILLILKPANGELPQILPGQFVEIRIPDTAGTYLRRPISIHDVDYEQQTLSLLIRVVGNGTHQLSLLHKYDVLNLVYPLGNGFNTELCGNKPLLIGGGVGIAPLLYLGRQLKSKNVDVNFLFGARTKNDILRYDVYNNIAPVNITTEDGSQGVKGFVTDHEFLNTEAINNFSCFMVCGPMPMMKAIATKAKIANKPCFVSLENKMACGIGVCLCCVTDTKEGHKCVCSDGPVFNINDLKWE